MKWFAWITEYLEDGSIVVDDGSRHEAIRLAAAEFNCEPEDVSVSSASDDELSQRAAWEDE